MRVAGNHYDEEILKLVRNKYSVAIGQRTAEELKKNVACCPQKTDFHETMEIKGRSLLTGLPVRVNVSTDDLYDPVMMLSEQIGTAAHQVLEKTPPELAGDIFRNGVMLTGGGAQLHGLTEYLSRRTEGGGDGFARSRQLCGTGHCHEPWPERQAGNRLFGCNAPHWPQIIKAAPFIHESEQKRQKEKISIFVEINWKIRYNVPKLIFC